jgi:phosphatidylserine decarboxylase
MDVHLDPKGNLSVIRGAIGYQFKQERGLAVVDSAIGLVAIIPIGMGIVSSVSFSALNNSILSKGSELGFFSFGGSDVVLLFQEGAGIDWLIKEGDTIQQGQSIAFANC